MNQIKLLCSVELVLGNVVEIVWTSVRLFDYSKRVGEPAVTVAAFFTEFRGYFLEVCLS